MCVCVCVCVFAFAFAFAFAFGLLIIFMFCFRLLGWIALLVGSACVCWASARGTSSVAAPSSSGLKRQLGSASPGKSRTECRQTQHSHAQIAVRNLSWRNRQLGQSKMCSCSHPSATSFEYESRVHLFSGLSPVHGSIGPSVHSGDLAVPGAAAGRHRGLLGGHLRAVPQHQDQDPRRAPGGQPGQQGGLGVAPGDAELHADRLVFYSLYIYIYIHISVFAVLPTRIPSHLLLANP